MSEWRKKYLGLTPMAIELLGLANSQQCCIRLTDWQPNSTYWIERLFMATFWIIHSGSFPSWFLFLHLESLSYFRICFIKIIPLHNYLYSFASNQTAISVSLMAGCSVKRRLILVYIFVMMSLFNGYWYDVIITILTFLIISGCPVRLLAGARGLLNRWKFILW